MAGDPSDDLQKLEEKLYQAMNLFKENEKARKSLKKEIALLRREREEIRSRVEKILQRISGGSDS